MYHLLWGCKTIKVLQFLLRIPNAFTSVVALWLDIRGPQRKKSNEFVYLLTFQLAMSSIKISAHPY